MLKLIASAAAATGFVLISVGPASADQIVVEVPHQVVSGLSPGTEFLLAEQSVALEHQGLVCSGQIAAQNNASVHPGNDLRVSTGDSAVVLSDVEGSANKITPLATPITLGSDIHIHLIMGADERFSGGMHLELQCEPPPPDDDDVSPGGFSSPGGAEVTTTTAVAGASGQAPGLVGQTPGGIAAQSPARAAPQQLPATGPDEALLAGTVGMLLLGLGGALTAVARRSASVRD